MTEKSNNNKEILNLPWIRCPWCEYRDKIEFDLSLHFLEQHKKQLLALPITRQDRLRTRFESAIEFRLDVAVEMAKEENRNKGVKHAIKQIQKQELAKHQEHL